MLQQKNEIQEAYVLSAHLALGETRSISVLEMPASTQTLPPLCACGSGQPPIYPPVSAALLPFPTRDPHPTGAIMLLALALVLAITFGIGLFAGWQFARNVNNANATSQFATTSANFSPMTTLPGTQQEAAIARIRSSVVELKVTTRQDQWIASGVIIDGKGDIVTNNHVVMGARSIQVVLSTGRTELAKLVGTNASADLAVVRVHPFKYMTVAQLGDSSRLVVGQQVFIIGSPLGNIGTATRGIVSAIHRSVNEPNGTTIKNAIQTSAALNPGDSGGALVNLQGQLIGIPILMAIDPETNTAANGLGFAIASNIVKVEVERILH